MMLRAVVRPTQWRRLVRPLATAAAPATQASGSDKPIPTEEIVKITFVDKDNDRFAVKGRVGENILEVAHKNEIELEGACGGTLACSTCHVILEKRIYEMLPEPTEEENDMLDLAFGLCKTSRLGCQVKLQPAMEGMFVKLPGETYDARNNR